MSSKQRAASDFPEPDIPVMMTRRRTLRLLVARLAPRRRLVGARAPLDPLAELPRQLPRRVVPLQLEQMIAGRHLDEHGEVTSRPDRHLDVREADAEDLVPGFVEPEAVVLLSRLPRVEPDDVLDEF